VPFGPQYGEFFAWKIYGGGDQLQKEIYGQHGLTKFDCNSTGPETSGCLRQKVGSLA
jgi:TRAP-type mannitol/chloroaromatic compound transport system substrate-binding protein